MNSDLEKTLIYFRQCIINGNIETVFEGEDFIFDILKALYNENIDIWTKTELLILVEEYGCSSHISRDGVEQIIGTMLDVFQQFHNQESYINLSCQTLVTSTSLLIVDEQFDTDICRRVVNSLLSIATSNVNSVETRRIRSTSLQCLLQLEQGRHGILFKEKDSLMTTLRKERTDLYQDYVILVTSIIEHAICVASDSSSTGNKSGNGRFDRQNSLDPQENRQLVSLVMDNIAVFTPCGLWHITLSLMNMVQNFPEVSPTIFKPMMLHHMASMDILLIHLIVFIQREFEKEVLSDLEENQLIVRVVTGINHPSLTPAQRLFFCHWIEHMQPEEDVEMSLPLVVTEKYKLAFYPRAFDPVDCQLSKINLLNKCFQPFTTKEDGIAAALLLGSVGYLHKLVSHTGSDRPAVVLFRGLFQMYQRHCSRSFSQDINRFLRGLISGFPFFIPHALGFIECLRETTPDSPVYIEVLSLLHRQVISTPEEQTATYFFFYLQVLKRASLEKELAPEGTLRFLHYLTENAELIDGSSWKLGTGILSVCHNLLLCHGTQGIYEELTALLFYLMIRYRDTDIRDRARFYYMMITSATDKKVKRIIQPMLESQSYQQALSALLPEKQDGTGYSQVKVLDHGILQWKRIKLQIETIVRGENDCDSFSSLDNYQQYHSKIKENKMVLKAVYKLNLIENYEEIHAVCCHVEKDSNYEDIPEVYLARIKQDSDPMIDIDFIPTLPIPSSFNIWAEFIHKSQTFRCNLRPLKVQFEDLVSPLPFSQFEQQTQSEVYDKLWKWILEDTKLEGTNCIKSVKVIHQKIDEFKSTTCQTLSKCFIFNKDDSSDLKIGIMLPPHYHLLMHVKDMSGQYLVVTMVTDTYHILLHIDKFLQG